MRWKIADDITFEKEFCKKYPNITCYAYDGTINGLPESNNNIQFIKKNITSYNSQDTTNLFDMFEKYNNIFLKMDIETYEFRWLQTLSNEQLNKINQILCLYNGLIFAKIKVKI